MPYILIPLFYFSVLMQAAREEWAQTLWANLNVNHLVDGIEGYIKSLKKLPRDVKGTPTARMVEGRMKEFKDSIPLFVDLKNEALRERSVDYIVKV